MMYLTSEGGGRGRGHCKMYRLSLSCDYHVTIMHGESMMRGTQVQMETGNNSHNFHKAMCTSNITMMS